VSGPIKSGLSIILQRESWRNILTYSGTIAELTSTDLDLDFLADSQHFHLCSFYLQTALQPHVAAIFKRLKDRGLTTSLDTNDDPEDRWEGGLREVLPHVDVFFPNAREARRIAGTDDLEVAIKFLAEIVPWVVIKLGQEGAMAQRGKERFFSPAFRVDAVDAVGAGDSFDAGFLHEFVKGSDLTTCLNAGNRAGALSATRAGGTEAFRDSDHRQDFLRSHDVALTQK
jgi:sugar/nucleoside kinase (ribokinase family)